MTGNYGGGVTDHFPKKNKMLFVLFVILLFLPPYITKGKLSSYLSFNETRNYYLSELPHSFLNVLL